MVSPKDHKRLKHQRFRGHANYRKAHKQILSHPLPSEPQYFQSPGFSPDQIFWPLETASTRRSSISYMTDFSKLLERLSFWRSGFKMLARHSGNRC